jgi:two-component system, cell cycle sensor histidine kinase and response regulator CckA
MTESARLYLPFLGLGTLLSLVLAAYGWGRRRLVPGGAAFCGFNLGVAVWTGAYIVELDATGPAAVFWANAAFFGIVLVPASWLVFALRYSGHGAWVTRRFLALLLVEPIATVLLAWTNPWHHWFRGGEQVTPTWEPAPAFWVHVAYSYALVLVGTVLMVRGAKAGRRLWRGQSSSLLIAAFAPWAANAIYLSGLSPFGNLDLSPFGFLATSLAVAFVLFRDLERRLVAAEKRFRTLIDQAIDAIEVIEPETGRILDVNERACAARGYSRDEYLRLRAPDLDSEGARRPWEETRDEVRRLGSCVFESEHRRKDGSVFPVEVNATYVPLDRHYVLAVVRDITERKRAEERQARLSRVVEQTSDSIVITDPQGTITYVNPAFESISGYSRDEVIGQNPRVLKSGHQDAAFYKRMWDALSRGEVWKGRLVNRRKDGVLFQEDATIGPVRDASGQVVSYVAAKRDITNEMKLERQLMQAQKMEAIGRLAGGVAHDFNNLLGVILGYGEMTRRGLSEDHPLAAKVDQILKAAERAASLTRQLLAFSRMQVLEPRIVDLNALVSNLETMLVRLIGEDVELKTSLAADLGHVKVDPGQVEQVVMNLVVNARDAMPDGGHLAIETARAEFDADYVRSHAEARAGAYAMLAVSDSGMGIDAATQAHIFEPFFTTKELGRGTGLGLSTVYGIVKQSGGYIWCYSEVGIGTTFKVYLPLVAEEGASVPPSASPVPLAPGRETILLIEDEESLRDLLCETLENGGYTVLVADGGEKALRISEEFSGAIQLIVTDVIMPGLTGRQAAERIKVARSEVQILFISGYVGDALARHGVFEPQARFLSKPFTADALLRKVREVLDGR